MNSDRVEAKHLQSVLREVSRRVKEKKKEKSQDPEDIITTGTAPPRPAA